MMNMATTNKAINFQSDRGNDIYREREVIRIKLDAGSAPLVNTADSYLTFSLKMGQNDKAPGGYLIPDPALGGIPFEQISIFDGNETTLLEQMDACGLFHTMRNYYGNNKNDDNIQKIYEGRADEMNKRFIGEGTAAAPRKYAEDGGANHANRPVNLGGGYGSQFYTVSENNTIEGGRKAQIIYRFPMSGLLSAMKSELLPLVVLNGLVIKITLMEKEKFLRLQRVFHSMPNENNDNKVAEGYGILSDDAQTQTLPVPAPPNSYTADRKTYKLYAYIDNAGAEQVADIPNATDIGGLVLAKNSDGGANALLDSAKNCAIRPGSIVGIGPDAAAGDFGPVHRLNYDQTGPNTPAIVDDNRVASVALDANGRVKILFKANITTGNSGQASFATTGNPVVCDKDGFNVGYEVSDIQFVANVVEAPAGYMETMINQAQSGQLKIQYNSYRDERVNITTGSLSNEIFIPSDLQRCYCILAANEVLRASSIARSDFPPSRENLFNYQWILDGTNTPNIPVDLKRLAANKVSPLHIIELEKALDESSIRIRNIQNPGEFAVIGRRLGAYGDSVSLLDKIIKCRINYSPSQNNSLMWHFWIYHTKTIMFEGGSRVVVE